MGTPEATTMPYFFAVLAGLCWGVGEVFTRAVLRTREITPMTAIAVRSTLALPLIWLAWWASRALASTDTPRLLERASAPTLGKLVLGSGVLAGAGGMVFFYLALGGAEVSRVKPIAFGLAPATAVIVAWLVLGEGLGLSKGLGLLLIVGGVILLTSSGGH